MISPNVISNDDTRKLKWNVCTGKTGITFSTLLEHTSRSKCNRRTAIRGFSNGEDFLRYMSRICIILNTFSPAKPLMNEVTSFLLQKSSPEINISREVDISCPCKFVSGIYNIQNMLINNWPELFPLFMKAVVNYFNY